MKRQDLALKGLFLIIPDIFQDDRGFFFESYNQSKYNKIGIKDDFVQDNHSKSFKNTLHGLHYQSNPGQAKIIRVIKGAIFDVAVDIRPDSETCGQWIGVELSEENKKQFFVPIGFAHGFCVLSEEAEVLYKCSSLYNSETEHTISWDDPDIEVNWPVSNPLLSDRDKNGQSFREYLKDKK